MSARTPTLLVFTLGPGCEAARRRLLPGGLRQAEHQLHQPGLETALAAGRGAGCRLVVCSPTPLELSDDVAQLGQQGRCFATRLRRAIRRLQGAHPDAPLIVVGTDVPDLSARHLQEAVARLRQQSDQVVLGPCPDGGFYLLATRRSIDRELGRARWCRTDTLSSLLRALRHRGKSATLLPPLRDLDLSADLEIWLSEVSRTAGGVPSRNTRTALDNAG